jgi:hypothetical protein
MTITATLSLYVMSDDEGKFIQCWDEGYNGYHAVPEELRNEAYLRNALTLALPSISTIASTLPYVLRLARNHS